MQYRNRIQLTLFIVINGGLGQIYVIQLYEHQR